MTIGDKDHPWGKPNNFFIRVKNDVVISVLLKDESTQTTSFCMKIFVNRGDYGFRICHAYSLNYDSSKR